MNNLTKLQNIPLVKAVEINSPIKSGSLFFGVGLMTSKQLGVVLPFDILGLFFTSELIRRSFNLKTCFVILGDSHAISNQTIDPTQINRLADELERGLNKLIHNFTLTNFQIIRASNFHSEKSFQQILTSVPNLNNEYLRLETADCLWLKQNKNLQVKVGWTMAKSNSIVGNDERFFDAEIKKFLPELNFVHLEPGWTFDPFRPRVSPYISIAGENRLLLTRNQCVTELGICAPHLSKIVRAAEILWGKLPFSNLEDKVRFLIDKAVF